MQLILVLLAGCGASSESGNAASTPGAAVTWHQEEIHCTSDGEVWLDVGQPYVFQVLTCYEGYCSESGVSADYEDERLRVPCVADTVRRVSWAE